MNGTSRSPKLLSVAWLRAGILVSNLPNRLMDEFGISATLAGELAGKVIERYRDKPESEVPGPSYSPSIGTGSRLWCQYRTEPLQFFSGEAGRDFVVKMADFFAVGRCQIA